MVFKCRILYKLIYFCVFHAKLPYEIMIKSFPYGIVDSCGKTLRTEYEYLLRINLFAKLWENEVVARCIYKYSLNIDIFLMIDQVILKR